jgi:hypothetical protein
MKDSHYTPNGLHPDDAIWKTQSFIRELSKVQDAYFQNLVEELKLTSKGADYLFDFIYNGNDDDDSFDSFADYLSKYSRCDYEDLVEDSEF